MRYTVGTIVQRRNGYIFRKTEDGRLTSESRFVASQLIERRELLKNEKVYHKNGDRTDNRAQNLVVLRFNTTRYRLLPASQVLFDPTRGIDNRHLAPNGIVSFRMRRVGQPSTITV